MSGRRRAASRGRIVGNPFAAAAGGSKLPADLFSEAGKYQKQREEQRRKSLELQQQQQQQLEQQAREAESQHNNNDNNMNNNAGDDEDEEAQIRSMAAAISEKMEKKKKKNKQASATPGLLDIFAPPPGVDAGDAADGGEEQRLGEMTPSPGVSARGSHNSRGSEDGDPEASKEDSSGNNNNNNDEDQDEQDNDNNHNNGNHLSVEPSRKSKKKKKKKSKRRDEAMAAAADADDDDDDGEVKVEDEHDEAADARKEKKKKKKKKHRRSDSKGRRRASSKSPQQRRAVDPAGPEHKEYEHHSSEEDEEFDGDDASNNNNNDDSRQRKKGKGKLRRASSNGDMYNAETDTYDDDLMGTNMSDSEEEEEGDAFLTGAGRAKRDRERERQLKELEQKQVQEAKRQSLREMLFEGGVFLKYGRSGKPHYRNFCLTPSGNFHWDSTPMNAAKPMPSKNFVRLVDVREVVTGKRTAVLLRAVARNAPEDLCFSIVTKKRSVDMQATTKEQRDLWVLAIRAAVLDVQIPDLDEKPQPKGADKRLERSVSYSYGTWSPNKAGAMFLALSGSPSKAGGDKKRGGKPTPLAEAFSVHTQKAVAMGYGTISRGSFKKWQVKNSPNGKTDKVITIEDLKRGMPPSSSSSSSSKGKKKNDKNNKAASPSNKSSKQQPMLGNGAHRKTKSSSAIDRPKVRRSMSFTPMGMVRAPIISRKAERVHSRNSSLSSPGGGPGGMPAPGAGGSKRALLSPEQLAKAEKYRQQREEQAAMIKLLAEGQTLIKYGRYGSPNAKHVNCAAGRIFWVKPKLGRQGPKSKVKSYIVLSDVRGVFPGKTTEVFSRRIARKALPRTCFSLVTKNRSLDLQAANEESRDLWVKSLRIAIARAKEKARLNWLNMQRAQSEEEPITVEEADDAVDAGAHRKPMDTADPVDDDDDEEEEAALSGDEDMENLSEDDDDDDGGAGGDVGADDRRKKKKKKKKNKKRSKRSKGKKRRDSESSASSHDSSDSDEKGDDNDNNNNNGDVGEGAKIRRRQHRKQSSEGDGTGLLREFVDEQKRLKKRSKSSGKLEGGETEHTASSKKKKVLFSVCHECGKKLAHPPRARKIQCPICQTVITLRKSTGSLKKIGSDQSVDGDSDRSSGRSPGLSSTASPKSMPGDVGDGDDAKHNGSAGNDGDNTTLSPQDKPTPKAPPHDSTAHESHDDEDIHREYVSSPPGSPAVPQSASRKVSRESETETETETDEDDDPPPPPPPPDVHVMPSISELHPGHEDDDLESEAIHHRSMQLAHDDSMPPPPPPPESPPTDNHGRTLHNNTTDENNNKIDDHDNDDDDNKQQPERHRRNLSGSGPSIAVDDSRRSSTHGVALPSTDDISSAASATVTTSKHASDDDRDDAQPGSPMTPAPPPPAPMRTPRYDANGDVLRSDDEEDHEAGGAGAAGEDDALEDAPTPKKDSSSSSSKGHRSMRSMSVDDVALLRRSNRSDASTDDGDDTDERDSSKPKKTKRKGKSKSKKGSSKSKSLSKDKQGQNAATDDASATKTKKKKTRQQVKEELLALIVPLRDVSHKWDERASAMRKISELAEEHHATELHMWPDFQSRLQKAVTAQLTDLRSRIIKEATHMLVALAAVMGDRFEDMLCAVLPQLLTRLYVSIKVISGAADKCIRQLLRRCHTSKCVPLLADAAIKDTHAIVRSRCAEYLALIVHECPDEPKALASLNGQHSPLSNVMIKVIEDSDGDARRAARRLFIEYEKRWPNDAQRMWHKFSAASQRSITAQRSGRPRLSKSHSASSISARRRASMSSIKAAKRKSRRSSRKRQSLKPGFAGDQVLSPTSPVNSVGSWDSVSTNSSWSSTFSTTPDSSMFDTPLSPRSTISTGSAAAVVSPSAPEDQGDSAAASPMVNGAADPESVSKSPSSIWTLDDVHEPQSTAVGNGETAASSSQNPPRPSAIAGVRSSGALGVQSDDLDSPLTDSPALTSKRSLSSSNLSGSPLTSPRGTGASTPTRDELNTDTPPLPGRHLEDVDEKLSLDVNDGDGSAVVGESAASNGQDECQKKRVKFVNMVSVDEADDELKNDVREECQEFGPVESVDMEIDRAADNVTVFVVFATAEAALKCQQALHMQYFGDRQIEAFLV